MLLQRGGISLGAVRKADTKGHIVYSPVYRKQLGKTNGFLGYGRWQ